MPTRRTQKYLSAADIKALTSFLASEDRPEGTLSFHETQGFVFTIASAPETIAPSEWLPLISNEREMSYASMEEAQETLQRLMAIYNEINTGVLERSNSLPVGSAFHEDILANLDEAASISQWSRGFMLGHGWLEELWNEYLPDALDQECGATVMTLSFFGSRQIAEAYVAEIGSTAKGKPPPSLEEFAETMRELFPSALASYAHLGRSIFEARMQTESDNRPEPVRSSKTGRNDPCPCGSGKKYKKCCGGVLH